ncbi:extracellular ribonuclease LE-like [Actinidia eriantha]|uniref:extracellular ribonuclease LE-like n=1 Tax=Actinidia eriantha TaxID=165200 RepID=UPI00258730E3|nr:extracellular ribonuclease LE-like [Actinidia eriantha]
MKTSRLILIPLLVIQCLPVLCFSTDFDFFYFVQQWPGSYCDTKKSCCYPCTGKPRSDFGIHGLWPNYEDGTYPSNCDPQSPFDESEISDLTSRMQSEWPSLACPSSNGSKFWAHEWNKHGTCSQSVLNQHDYFAAVLNLKNKVNLLQILISAGIIPNGQLYSIESIKEAIRGASGHSPWIECNVDPCGNSQLYQIYQCVDTSALTIIECPVLPRGRGCDSKIEFPSF